MVTFDPAFVRGETLRNAPTGSFGGSIEAGEGGAEAPTCGIAGLKNIISSVSCRRWSRSVSPVSTKAELSSDDGAPAKKMPPRIFLAAQS